MFYSRFPEVLLVLLTLSAIGVRGCLQQVNAPATPTPASLFSTHYPGHYDNDATCSWRIFSTTLGARVYVHIVEADLDDYNNQCADSLTFYNEVTPGEAPIHRVCGRESDVLIKSQGEQLYFNFTTDSERTSSGFYLIYWAAFEDEDHPSCNEVVRIGDSPQLLDLSSNIFRSTPCAVLIDAGDGHVVVLEPGSRSSEGLLDCSENFLRVFDGSSPEGSSVDLYCSEERFSWYRSSDRYLLVQTSLPSAPGTQFSVRARREPAVTDRCFYNDVPLIKVPFRPAYMWIPYHRNHSQNACPVYAALRSMGSHSDLEVTVLGSEVNSPLNCSINYIQVASYADELSTNNFTPKCDDNYRPVYRENAQSLVLGRAGNGSEEIFSGKYLLKVQSKGYICGNETNVIPVESDSPQTFMADIPIFSRIHRCRFLFNTTESTNHVQVEFKGIPQRYGVIYRLYDGTSTSSGYLGNYTYGSLTRPTFRSNSSSLLVELETREAVDVVSLAMEYSFVDTSEEELLFVPRSTYDPRVTIAIGLIVGLANGVGAIFLLAMVIVYFRSRSQSEKEEEFEEFEEHYQEMVEEK